MKLVASLSVLLLMALPATAQLATSHAPAPVGTPTAGKAPGEDLVTPKVTDKPVARVNGVTLTDRDLVREEYAIFPYARLHGGMPKSMEPQIRKGALDMIIFEELVYQDAVRRNLTVPEADLNRAEADFKGQFPNAAQYQRYLKMECKGSRQVLREKIRRSMLIEKMLKNEAATKATVTEADARVYFAKNSQQFQTGESFAIQSISILPPDNATPAQLADAKKRAEEAFKQAKTTKTYQGFGLVAEKSSEDDFRVNMGDHKAVTADKLPPQILKALSTMKAGEVSDLIQLGTAYTIFRLNAHVPAGTLKFADVKDRLMSGLQKDKFNQVRADLGKKLRKNARIEVL
jgi:hypothetical protein